jgi:NADPH:quinone reductase-like Zn-dependent oxidoreductase
MRTTMRAVVITGAGPQRFELADVPVPANGPDEILVRVGAVGVGIHDSYFLPTGISMPFPIGIEAAGVIERVGTDVTHRHRPGDRIAFVSANQLKGGTWAEYAVVRADSLIIPVPEELGLEQAAAVPVAGNTTLRALRTLPSIPEGGSVFVAGASGAIGTFAIQLARRRGWHVAGSASPQNHGYLASLGAALTVDYRDPTWPQQVRQWMPSGVDAALAVQPSTTASSADVVKDGGTVVTISGDTPATPARRVTVTLPSHTIDVRDELIDLVDQIAQGTIRLELERVYPFDEALTALHKVQTRHARGKVVLSLP